MFFNPFLPVTCRRAFEVKAIESCTPKKQLGYTLVELLVTMLIAAALMTAAVPSFRSVLQNARLAGDLERLTGSLRLAQSVASRSGEQAFVCASVNGETCSGSIDWSQGWIVVEQEGANERVVLIEMPTDGVTMRAMDLLEGSRIIFNPDGTITDTSAPGTFVFCDERGDASAKAAIVTNVGLVRDARDSNDSGVVEGALGTDIAC
jgi:type IV fimbrial biogenesis protein FimT